MGQFIGRGNWVWSYAEKQAYKQKKREEYFIELEAKRKADKKIYLTLTELKTFLNGKDIEEHFSKPSKEVKIKFGVMKQFKIEKVMSIIRKKNLQINIKKAFEKIENEDVKREVRYLELNQKLPAKQATTKKIVKI